MPSDPVSKLVHLRNARVAAADRAANARAAAAAKRAAPDAPPKSLNARDVRRWFETGCERHTKLSRLPSWRPQDWANAKRMLTEFGPPLEATVLWFFEHWEKYVEASRGRLNGIPTPSLMIAMKSQVFPDCEAGRIPGVDTSKRDRVRASEWIESDKAASPVGPDQWGLD
jgi:hypothetical protein